MEELSDRINSKYDWVTERFECSLPNVFKELRAQVEADVKTRNALRPENSPYEFSVAEKGADVVVHLKAQEGHWAVVFSLARHSILVRDDMGHDMFEVTATLNDKGECKLYVKEKERELWQVSRMALEDLLFHGD